MTSSLFDLDDGCLNCGALIDPGDGDPPFCDQRCEDRYDQAALARAARWYRFTRMLGRAWRALVRPI